MDSLPQDDVAAVKHCSEAYERMRTELGKVIVGQEEVIEQVLVAMLSAGHALLEGVPGLAKTLLVRSLAAVVGGDFHRLQFTPDLLPADVTGTLIFDPKTSEFVAHKGPVFANLVLADEINRAPAKVQSALLEAMEERQVTIGDETFPLPEPFVVLATQNPIEQEGTYPLPEAQLDRFLLRLRIGYPEPDHERELLRRRFDRGTDQPGLDAVTDAAGLRRLQATVELVEAGDDVVDYAVRLVEATREHSALEIGASPRGSLALVKVARAHAALAGRGFATPDDVKNIAISVLAHRLVLRTEAWVRGVREDDVVQEVLDEVPTPTTLTDADRQRLNA